MEYLRAGLQRADYLGQGQPRRRQPDKDAAMEYLKDRTEARANRKVQEDREAHEYRESAVLASSKAPPSQVQVSSHVPAAGNRSPRLQEGSRPLSPSTRLAPGSWPSPEAAATPARPRLGTVPSWATLPPGQVLVPGLGAVPCARPVAGPLPGPGLNRGPMCQSSTSLGPRLQRVPFAQSPSTTNLAFSPSGSLNVMPACRAVVAPAGGSVSVFPGFRPSLPGSPASGYRGLAAPEKASSMPLPAAAPLSRQSSIQSLTASALTSPRLVQAQEKLQAASSRPMTASQSHSWLPPLCSPRPSSPLTSPRWSPPRTTAVATASPSWSGAGASPQAFATATPTLSWSGLQAQGAVSSATTPWSSRCPTPCHANDAVPASPSLAHQARRIRADLIASGTAQAADGNSFSWQPPGPVAAETSSLSSRKDSHCSNAPGNGSVPTPSRRREAAVSLATKPPRRAPMSRAEARCSGPSSMPTHSDAGLSDFQPRVACQREDTETLPAARAPPRTPVAESPCRTPVPSNGSRGLLRREDATTHWGRAGHDFRWCKTHSSKP